MPFYSSHTLRELRAKIDISQRALALVLGVSKKTVVRYERDGTTNRDYIDRLLHVIEHPEDTRLPQTMKRGPQLKPYRLARPRRVKEYKKWRNAADSFVNARYRLYAPEHKDHMRFIEGPPKPSARITQWLERDNPQVHFWRKCSIRPDGTIDYWGIYVF